MAAKKTASTARKAASAMTAIAPKQRASATPRSSRSSGKAGQEVVTIDRRRGREESETEVAAEPQLERRQKVQRRRQIDPTTCERDYSTQEVEFMNAMDDYKRKNGRMFPTCSEVLEVIRSLGYVQISAAGRAMLSTETEINESAEEFSASL